jgi:hypothetical protein
MANTRDAMKNQTAERVSKARSNGSGSKKTNGQT